MGSGSEEEFRKSWAAFVTIPDTAFLTRFQFEGLNQHLILSTVYLDYNYINKNNLENF